MKKFSFAILCILLCNILLLSAQINIKTYNMTDTIEYMYSDSSMHGHYILLKTPFIKKDGKHSRTEQNLILFNLDTEKAEWKVPCQKNIYTREEGIYPTQAGIMVNDGWYNYSMLDYKTGKALWTLIGTLKSLDPLHNAFFFLRNTNSLDLKMPKMEYMDLKTTHTIWSQKIVWRDSNWGDFYYMNDSTMYAINNSLRLINLKNGEIKKYKVDIMNPWSLRGTQSRSNIVFQDSCFYMSDRKKIICLDHNLKEKWSTELPKKSASLSYIYLDSTNIYMVNYGLSQDYALRVKGYPFIAAFNKKTGKQHFFTQMADAKTPINDFFSMGNEQYMLFDDHIVCAEMKEHTALRDIKWNSTKYGPLYKMQFKDVYVATDSTHFKKLTAHEQLLVITQRGYLCKIDPMSMNVDTTYTQYYIPVICKNNNTLLTDRKNQIFIINEKGEQKQVIKQVNMLLPDQNKYAYVLLSNHTTLLRISL